jgi:hypothetical protein
MTVLGVLTLNNYYLVTVLFTAQAQISLNSPPVFPPVIAISLYLAKSPYLLILLSLFQYLSM